MSRIYEEDIHTNKHNQIYTQKHVDFVSIFVVLVLAAGLPVPSALGLGRMIRSNILRDKIYDGPSQTTASNYFLICGI